MSILSQVGVVVLILFIGFVIFKANKNVDKAAQEGEKFKTWEEYKKDEEKAKEQEIIEAIMKTQEEERAEAKESSPNFSNEKPKKEPTAEYEEKAHFFTLIHLNEHQEIKERIPVDHLPFYIGRARENSLILEDLSVARQHCRIVKRDHIFLLETVSPSSKIAVDGTRLCDTCTLQDGERFFLGNEEFLVEMR